MNRIARLAADLKPLDARLQELGQLAKDCNDRQLAGADKLDKELALLGKPTPGEYPAVAKARRDAQ